MIIRVAVFAPLYNLFDYETSLTMRPGERVLVPFGRRRLVAVVIETHCQTALKPDRLRTVIRRLDETPSFDAITLKLCRFAADYYQHPLGETLATALPALLRGPEIHRTPMRWHLHPETGYHKKLTEKQRTLIALLSEQAQSTQALSAKNIHQNTLKSLEAKNLIVQKPDMDLPKRPETIKTLALNAEQKTVLQAIKAALNQFQVFLLEGITGSGKTEVYIQACLAVIQQQQQVFIMVPEISLTPQLRTRFHERFGDICLVMHSGLSPEDRLAAWENIHYGKKLIIIGTRSAIFSNFKQLKLIIIDEEHDASLKQQEGLKYSARDLACLRAKLDNIPLILGSATPSLETLYNVQQGKFIPLQLKKRIADIALPSWHVIDMRQQYTENGLSVALITQIKATLARQEQVLIFLNRRGFSPVLLCTQCGYSVHCPACDKNMTYYEKEKRLRCHHCETHLPKPSQCPECATPLHPQGFGTERIEETLRQLFPNTDIVRIDRNSMRKKGALEKALNPAYAGKSQILLGTQMLAKGHHFPNVSLVAILNGDSSLYSIDFRALEQFGQLLTQVAGRAGRSGHQSSVYLQTLNPEHKELRFLLAHGYHAFAMKLLEERERLLLPPCSHIALIHAEARELTRALDFLAEFKTQFDNTLTVLGPSPAPMPKRAGKFRVQLLVQTHSRQVLQTALQKAIDQMINGKRTKIKWSVDVDPLVIY